jgi:glycosyltransferase involved in cell wall biosynthesis
MGGGEESLFNLIAHLDRNIFTPIITCPEDGPLSEKLRSRGVDVIPMEFPRVRSMSGVIGTIKRLKSLALQKGAHIVHSNSIRTHIYGAIVGKYLGLPVVWHERNLITTELVDPDRILSFLADRIICNSGAIARRFLSWGRLPDKVVTVHNGVDLERFSLSIDGSQLRQRLGIGSDEIVIGIASRFNIDKGHEIFFQAARSMMSEVRDRGLKIRFLVAGGAVFKEDMERESYLRKYASDLGIESAVTFTGFSTDMPAIYAGMDIFALASFAEPCGRVIFEAMAMGRPMVATNTGGTPEIVVDGLTGILIMPRDPAAMAAALKELVLDKAKRIAMGKEARKRIEEHFSIQKNVQRTEALYNELLKRKGVHQ